LAHANPDVLIASMQALGVNPDQLIEQEGLGNVQGLVRWLGAFQDVHVNVREVVRVIRNSPYLPRVPVHGLVINIETGKLEMVDKG
jgi:carbonic anhydrase